MVDTRVVSRSGTEKIKGRVIQSKKGRMTEEEKKQFNKQTFVEMEVTCEGCGNEFYIDKEDYYVEDTLETITHATCPDCGFISML